MTVRPAATGSTTALPDRILAVRLDRLGDVLLTGPAIRALARRAHVTLAVSGNGSAAAHMLPGVADIIRFDCPWIVSGPGHADPVDSVALGDFVDDVRARGIRHAVIFTSDRQSPLPTALVLRLAGVEHITAHSEHHPGSLLDLCVDGDPDAHEVERNVGLVGAMGFPIDDQPRLAVCRSPLRHGIADALPDTYVVVHPGAAEPARTMTPARWVAAIHHLRARGHRVVITGAAADGARGVADECPEAIDLVGRTTFVELASVIAHAAAVCVGNTGVMHLAAAVGTPIAAVFPATVPVHRWQPWGVRHEVLGMQDIGCALCHRRECHLARHPCAAIGPQAVVLAVEALMSPHDRQAEASSEAALAS